MTGGATAGERAAARTCAEAMAKKAGMTLKDVVSKMDARPAPEPANFLAGFDDWMETKEPGYKAKEARKRAERNAGDAARRAEILKGYASERAVLTRNERGVLLDAAIEPLVSEWAYWTDDDRMRHRYAETIEGRAGSSMWTLKHVTPAIRAAVMDA